MAEMLRSQISEILGGNPRLIREFESISKAANEARATLETLRTEMETMTDEIATMTEQADALTASNKKLSSEVKSLSTQLSTLEESAGYTVQIRVASPQTLSIGSVVKAIRAQADGSFFVGAFNADSDEPSAILGLLSARTECLVFGPMNNAILSGFATLDPLYPSGIGGLSTVQSPGMPQVAIGLPNGRIFVRVRNNE